nr:NYN domain-containing protein [Chloroflexota bacterium]
MSKNVAMFVDVANMYYAARGQDVDVDYVALLKHATKGRDLIRAYAYTGLDPENENQRKFIDFLAKNGYKPVVKDIRKFGDGRVKANLDIELVVDLFRLQERMDVAVIVSGDGDFAPAIRALQDVGVRCEVISFRPNTSSDLIAVADEFFDIMKVASISRKRDEKAPVMPEMPAKESAPEFGFRDASPAVAAAALAALKSGNGARGTRGGRPAARTAQRPADESEPELPPAAIAIDDGSASEAGEGRRRRRRRGGRGRGRGRGREAAAEEGAAAAPPEVGWQEFDDLSELEGLTEDREYTFEEADPETLAELGLLDAPASPAPAEAPPPRSQGRAAPQPTSGESRTAGAEAKPRRRRAAAAKPATPEEPAEQTKPRRRTRAATGSD